MQIATFIQKFIRDEDGVAAIEYGLMAALIAVALITVVGSLGAKIALIFSNTTLSLTPVAASA